MCVFRACASVRLALVYLVDRNSFILSLVREAQQSPVILIPGDSLGLTGARSVFEISAL
jgi:hypothetical protein